MTNLAPIPDDATGAQPNMGQVLYTGKLRFKVSAPAEQLVIAIVDYAGKRYVNARIWNLCQSGRMLPSRKGIVFPLADLRRVIRALEAGLP